MNWLQCVLYGVTSGLSEFIPVSSKAHQALLQNLFGLDGSDALLNVIIHLAVLLSLITGCRNILEQIKRDSKLPRITRHRHGSFRNNLDLRFVKSGAIPLITGLVIFTYISNAFQSMAFVALFLLLNGILLFVPCRMLQGNKDARSMSGLDAIFVGLFGALSAFPGLSRIGMMTSVSLARGADRQHALNWALLLNMPALALLTFIDLLIIIAGAQTFKFTVFFCYILAGLGAYIGGYFGILIMKFRSIKAGFTGFAYYSWGAALFAFILYLI